MSNDIDYAKYKPLAEKYMTMSVIELIKNRENLYYGYFLAETKKLQNYQVQSFRTTITIQGIQLAYNPLFVVRTYELTGSDGLLSRLLVELNHLTLLHPEAGPMIKAFVEGMPSPELLATVAMDIAATHYAPKRAQIPCPCCNPQQWDIDNDHVYQRVVLEYLGKQPGSERDILLTEEDACPLCNNSKVMYNLERWATHCEISVRQQIQTLSTYNDGIGAIKQIAQLDDDTRKALCAYATRYQLVTPKAEEGLSQAVANSIVKSTVHHIMSSKGVGTSGSGILSMFMEKIQVASVPYILTLKGMLSASMGTNKVSTRYRPNRRFGYQYLGKRSYPKMRYVVAIDTSGSVTAKEVSEVLGELLALKQYSSEVECRVILFHHSVWADVDLDEFDTEEFTKKFQSGGTNFDVVLVRVFEGTAQDGNTTQQITNSEDTLRGHRELVTAEQRAMLVMMTDGYCNINFNKDKIHGRIVWLLTKGGTKSNILDWDANAEILELN